jgi:Zn-finger nucleic acid-binding protein
LRGVSEATLTCPGCRNPMRPLDLVRRAAGTMVIDLCVRCEVLWFDPMESPQLSAAATLELFRAINEAQPQVHGTLPRSMGCPRCASPLALTQDLQHTTRFSYYRCQRGHGRLTPFFQFLREKNFIRPVPDEELARLKALVRIIRCGSCGAPIDLAKSTACEFCRAPIAILDPEAASQALRELSSAKAIAERTQDAAARAAAGVMAAAEFERALAREQAQRQDGYAVDLVQVGLAALASILNSH